MVNTEEFEDIVENSNENTPPRPTKTMAKSVINKTFNENEFQNEQDFELVLNENTKLRDISQLNFSSSLLHKTEILSEQSKRKSRVQIVEAESVGDES